LQSYTQNRPQNRTALSVNLGKKNVLVHIADIVSIQAATPYVALHTKTGKHLYSASLKEMIALLDGHEYGNEFVRIHKSTIVNIKHVVQYISRLNGDYDVTLADGSVVRMSRNYSSVFKQKLESHALIR
jgi:two-component system, LytTR family, response regulator